MAKRNEIYTEELLRELVGKSQTVSDVLRKLGLRTEGNHHGFITRKIRKFGIDTSHFLTRNQYSALGGKGRKSPDEVLVLMSPEAREVPGYRLRAALLDSGRLYMCLECGLGPEWNGKPLVLQVDHINGKGWDNRPVNLRFICPNCHTQTPTFCSKNHTNQKVKPTCKECGNKVSRGSSMCRKCFSIRPKAHTPQPEKHKVQHPSIEELRGLLDTVPMTKIGKMFNVSATSIRKWARRYGIDLPKRIPTSKKTKKPKFKRTIVDGKTWCCGHKDWIAVGEFTKRKSDPLGLFHCCRECRKKEKGRSKKNGGLAESGIAPVC